MRLPKVQRWKSLKERDALADATATYCRHYKIEAPVLLRIMAESGRVTAEVCPHRKAVRVSGGPFEATQWDCPKCESEQRGLLRRMANLRTCACGILDELTERCANAKKQGAKDTYRLNRGYREAHKCRGAMPADPWQVVDWLAWFFAERKAFQLPERRQNAIANDQR